jgi:antitoxin VapB
LQNNAIKKQAKHLDIDAQQEYSWKGIRQKESGMERNAKQFRDGKSQVNPDNWDLLLAMIAKTEMPHDFLTAEEHRQEVVDRDPFRSAAS